MKYKIVLSFVTACTIASAMELRIGSATFGWQMGMGFMQSDFDLDAQVWSLGEQHNSFGESRLYYFYGVDLYRSDYVDRLTTLITTPLTYDFPLFGSFNDALADHTSLPVPADYKIRGFDLNLGIGYDLLKNDRSYLGIGINTGLSLPVLKMKNLRKSASVTYDLLDHTDTTIKTYKLGPILHAGYRPASSLLLYTSFGAGLQTGTIENGWIASSLSIDGSYSTLDLGLRYTPWQSTRDLGWIRLDPKLFLTAGFTRKSWRMDDAKIKAFNIAQFDSGGLFTDRFDANYWYLGIGYDF